MRPWRETWQSHYDTGGLPASSVSAAHMQLHQSLHRGAWALAQQDVAAFFDSLHWEVLEAILHHLRARAELLPILRSFYMQSKRIFVLEGAFSHAWTEQTTGIAQGCPLSPYLAAAVTHCWCELVITKGITGFGYLDDRTILLQKGCSLQVLRDALQRSADFDRVCGLACAPDKCFLAARQHSEESSSIAAQFQLQVRNVVDVLGVTVDLTGDWQLLKFSLRKAILRLRLLKWTQTSTFKKRSLVRSLVLPCLTWAAAFAAPCKEDLIAVRHEIFSLFNPWHGQEAARVLIFEHLSWHLEPEFATNLACIREIWRKWHEVFPRARAALDSLHWRLSADGLSLQRFDLSGTLRKLEVGVDSFRCDTSGGHTCKKLAELRNPSTGRILTLPVAWICLRHLPTTVMLSTAIAFAMMRPGTLILKVLDPILWSTLHFSTPLRPNHRRHTFTTAATVCLGCGLSLNVHSETYQRIGL